MEKRKYAYKGPVWMYENTLTTTDWEGETYAVNERRALSNIGYQFKFRYGYTPSSKIRLDKDCLKEVFDDE